MSSFWFGGHLVSTADGAPAGFEMSAAVEDGRASRTRRRTGLTIRTFRVARDGTRYDDSGVISANLGPDEYVARIEVWLACACPQHRAG